MVASPAPRLAVFLAAVLPVAAGCGHPAAPEEPVLAAAAVPDTLALLDLHLATATLDSVMAAEGARLDLACASAEAGCRRAHDPDRIVPLDILRAHPAVRAPSIGILGAHVRVPEDGWLAADLVFVGLIPGGTLPPDLLRPLGDWGYGIHYAVRHWTVVTRPDGQTRTWVRIPGAGSPEGGWLLLERGGLRGWLTPADDPVWWIGEEVRAESGASSEHVRILSIADGWVTMRAEVPSDMPCGEDAPPDPAGPGDPAAPGDPSGAAGGAEVRVRISDLFAPDGMPRIQPAYPRGC